MKVDVLVAEIGSTTTVVNAFIDLDSDRPCFWAQGQAPTSVLDGDVRIGLQGAIDDLCRKKGIDHLEYDQMLATSSAAGGLKMTVHGLVYDMTAKAAKEAALGAGGIIHDITVGRLRRTDLKRIKEINPRPYPHSRRRRLRRKGHGHIQCRDDKEPGPQDTGSLCRQYRKSGRDEADL